MTGNDLKRRREALGFSVEQLAESLGCQPREILLWESWNAGEIYFGYPQMLALALEQLGEQPASANGDDEIPSRTAVEVNPQGENAIRTLIAEAYQTIETLQAAIINADKQQVLPHTVLLMSQRKQRLQQAIQDAIASESLEADQTNK